MNEIIKKSEKLTELLKELQKSEEYEKCTYHVVPQPDRENWFFLVKIETKQIVADGTPDKVKAYLRLRKIDPAQVCDYRLIG